VATVTCTLQPAITKTVTVTYLQMAGVLLNVLGGNGLHVKMGGFDRMRELLEQGLSNDPELARREQSVLAMKIIDIAQRQGIVEIDGRTWKKIKRLLCPIYPRC
jgi:hypothetical protein